MNDPIDNHTCHCSVCKRRYWSKIAPLMSSSLTHVEILEVDNLDGLRTRQPFNAQNPDGPLELCTCSDCGTPIMLDDKQGRIRAIVPNLMGYDSESLPATYHAFYDASTGAAAPDDGSPVYDSLRPDFVWPASA